MHCGVPIRNYNSTATFMSGVASGSPLRLSDPGVYPDFPPGSSYLSKHET